MFSFGQKIETTLFFTEDFDLAAEGLNGFLYPQLPGFWGIDWRHEWFPGWFLRNRDKRSKLNPYGPKSKRSIGWEAMRSESSFEERLEETRLDKKAIRISFRHISCRILSEIIQLANWKSDSEFSVHLLLVSVRYFIFVTSYIFSQVTIM